MGRRSLRLLRTSVVSSLAVLLVLVAVPGSSGAAGTWSWPVSGPVVRGFDPPDSPFGSGHRGIDIAVPIGTAMLAPAPGTVSFAGPVGGHLFVTINHGGKLASTYSWVSGLLVRRGDAVAEGQAIAASGAGHPGGVVPSLHFGVKLDGEYVDPLAYLGPVSVTGFIRLAPLEPPM